MHPKGHVTDKKAALMAACGVLLVVLFLAACASGPHGGLQRSVEVTQRFQTYTAVSDYRYYHSGWSNNPYVIVAINPEYTLKDRLWTPFTPSSKTLQELMNALYNYRNLAPYGAYIMDHRGQRVGFWYSAIQWATVKIDDQANTVDILPDTPYLRDERRFIGRF